MRVVSVFGPFQSHVLMEMSADDARKLVPDGALGAAAPSRLIDAVLADLERLRRQDPNLADSALAMTALAMAYEIEHPFNSATSKSMCAGKLADALRELRELAPAEEVADEVDELARRRADRRKGQSAS